jgi:hypothetical protein
MATTLDREPLAHERPEHSRLVLLDDERQWIFEGAEARDGMRLRHAFRDYLESYGHPASDFDAAEAVYGELVGNCARHAPGPIRIQFRWEDATLVVTDTRDRLRTWPFSPDDTSAVCTHHSFAIVSALSARVHVTRAPGGGTRASVVLPVLPATVCHPELAEGPSVSR